MDGVEKASWIGNIFANPISTSILIVGILAIIVVLAILAKKGIISFKSKGFSIGSAESERTIVRQQIEYCETAVALMTDKLIATFKDADEWRIRYICELIYDVWISAVSFNHITKDKFYIESKAMKVWAIIQRETSTDPFKSEDFRKMVYDECSKVINQLVDIKEYYSK